MSKLFNHWDVRIVEHDGSVFNCVKKSRDAALKETNAAEKVRHCKAWRITFISKDYQFERPY